MDKTKFNHQKILAVTVLHIVGLFTTIIIVLITCFLVMGLRVDRVNRYSEDENYMNWKPTDISFPVFTTYGDVARTIEYHYLNYNLRGGYEVFMSAIYDDECFADEIARLNTYKYSKGIYGKQKYCQFYYDEDCQYFNYPTYIAFYSTKYKEQLYQYACVEYDENRITYILLRWMEPKQTEIDERYLPKNYANLFNKTVDESQLFVYPLT